MAPSRADRPQAQSRPFATGSQEYEEPTGLPRLSFRFANRALCEEGKRCQFKMGEKSQKSVVTDFA